MHDNQNNKAHIGQNELNNIQIQGNQLDDLRCDENAEDITIVTQECAIVSVHVSKEQAAKIMSPETVNYMQCMKDMCIIDAKRKVELEEDLPLSHEKQEFKLVREVHLLVGHKQEKSVSMRTQKTEISKFKQVILIDECNADPNNSEDDLENFKNKYCNYKSREQKKPFFDQGDYESGGYSTPKFGSTPVSPQKPESTSSWGVQERVKFEESVELEQSLDSTAHFANVYSQQ